jgi:hypothetical protein
MHDWGRGASAARASERGASPGSRGRSGQRRLSPPHFACFPALLFAASALAADFTGTWVGQYSGRNGEPADVALQIRQEGKSLSGKLYGDYRSSPIVDSTVSGSLVTFVVKSQEQAGNQINDTLLRFTGRLNENGELELVRDRERATNAGNNGGAPARQETKLILKLRKLI